MTKLRECPFCGGEASEGLTAFEQTYVRCHSCGVGTDYEETFSEAAAVWNHRTPAPMTSVIEWTRYDGTPETLPEEGVMALVYADRGMLRKAILTLASNGRWDDREEFYGVFKGDIWTYLPDMPDA